MSAILEVPDHKQAKSNIKLKSGNLPIEVNWYEAGKVSDSVD